MKNQLESCASNCRPGQETCGTASTKGSCDEAANTLGPGSHAKLEDLRAEMSAV